VSFQSNLRLAIDPSRPLDQRMSDARSCAVVVSEKWRVRRSVVLDRVREICGVDLLMEGTDDDLLTALTVLSEMRTHGLNPEVLADDPM
jgi:hypothetical protein